MEKRICRICWNTQNWRFPTGEAHVIEKRNKPPESDKLSFVAKYGYGHEEWLFHSEWAINGYNYGFLQAFGYNYNALQGKYFDIGLYTISPQNEHLWVATIKNAFVPKLDELKEVQAIYKAEGWLKEIVQNCKKLGFAYQKQTEPQNVINIKFKISEVDFSKKDTIADIGKNTRYTTALKAENIKTKHEKKLSEKERERRAIDATFYNPRHAKLQNILADILRKKYGKTSVIVENNRVDLEVRLPGNIIFIEVKMNLIAKENIRQALGQLIEYSNYPNIQKANSFIVMSDVKPTESDNAYLKYLKDNYNLPIYYSYYDFDKKQIIGWPFL